MRINETNEIIEINEVNVAAPETCAAVTVDKVAVASL